MFHLFCNSSFHVKQTSMIECKQLPDSSLIRVTESGKYSYIQRGLQKEEICVLQFQSSRTVVLAEVQDVRATQGSPGRATSFES